MTLSDPPRDAQGNVIPHDHTEITPQDGVIRRISELQTTVDASGQRRISSVAFKASSGVNGGLSVDLETLIIEGGHDPRRYVTTPRWLAALRFEAGQLRSEQFKVGYDPLIDNPYHGEVWGSFTKAQIRRLREMAVWFVEMPGVAIRDK